MALREYEPLDDWWRGNVPYIVGRCPRRGFTDDLVSDDEISTSDLDPEEIELVNFWREKDYIAIRLMVSGEV